MIEIDGASNNSVDDIRELIGNVRYLPTTGTYKVYIVDEVHMLSISAFNAFLKTLEEPPAHVVFIFATTEANKLPSTILSRFQRFDFRHVSTEQLGQHIKNIAKLESIEFADERTVDLLAKRGRGSVRDTLSTLDQVLGLAGGKIIDTRVVAEALGLASEESLDEIISAMMAGDIVKIGNLYSELLSENVQVKNLMSLLMDRLFDFIQTGMNAPALMINLKNGLSIGLPEGVWVYETLAKDLGWALDSIDPDRVIRVILQKLTLRRNFLGEADELPIVNSEVEAEGPVEKIEVMPSGAIASTEPEVNRVDLMETQEEPPAQEVTSIQASVSEPAIAPESKEATGPTEAVESTEIEEKSWEGFLTFLKQLSPASAANLEQGNVLAQPQMLDDKIVIRLGFKKSSLVFYDYLNEKTVFEKLLDQLANYYDLAKSKY